MRICLVFNDFQPFGGLEEYATSLAIALQQQSHVVSVFSTVWAPPNNQYLQRLRDKKISIFQPPAWISRPVSDWRTKEKILGRVMWLSSPLVMLLGTVLSVIKRRPWRESKTSAYNWLKGQWMDRVIGSDRRKVLGRAMLGFWRLFWRPDIFHIQGYTTSLLYAIDWLYRHNVPVVYEEHQTPDPQFNWWAGFESSINFADRVIAVSEKSAEGLREICGVTRPIVVRGPLLPDPFPSGWRKEARPFHPDTPFIVATVSRLYITKGLTYLLDAAAIVQRKYQNVQFRVYGEGDLRGELLEKAASLGLDGEGIFQGAITDRSELSRRLCEADLFLLSSILEGQPLAVVEAMAHGCPIVSTCVGGIPEIVQDGTSGLLCPPGNPQCLAEKILLVIEDFELRQRLGHAARAAFEAGSFQMPELSSHLASTYREVLEEKSRADSG